MHRPEPEMNSDQHDLSLIRANWPAPDNVHAFTTTRAGGFSQGVYSSLNLGAGRGDNPEHVKANRALLRRYALLPNEPAWLNQVHGTQVVDAATAGANAPDADASFSVTANVICTALTADCLPVLFCDQQGPCVAASHAGWRGLACGVLEATVSAMQVHPTAIMAWMGPAIGPLAYQVGNEVREQFMSENPDTEQAFLPSDGDRWMANLYVLARVRLQRLGIEHIYGGEYCTHSDPKRFFSYRRDAQYGCMASCIWYQP